ncbi:hypothetical protein PMIN03_008235 [Paraphaeosphaeria minitans]
MDFKRPPAPPYPNWSLTTTRPLPYRPFRHGPKYNITLGLRKMHWDEWIELDNDYMKYHGEKARRIAERGDKCCRTAPEALDGAVELLEELCDYLPQRYPSLYKKTAVGIDNLATGESLNIVQRPLDEDPMALAARLVQDDLAIMFERPDGQYYLLAGAILLAGFWRLSDKFGMPLSEIHSSGDVPGFKAKLEKSMMSFFRRVQPENPVLRNNYFIQVDDGLAWSESIGDEDEDGDRIGWFSAEKDKAIQHHMFRSERQSLRRYAHPFPFPGSRFFFSFLFFFSLFSSSCWGSDGNRAKQPPPLRRRRLHHPHVLSAHHGHLRGSVRPRATGQRGEELGRRCEQVQGEGEVW